MPGWEIVLFVVAALAVLAAFTLASFVTCALVVAALHATDHLADQDDDEVLDEPAQDGRSHVSC
ncbi:hypothetical protein NOZE110980_03100 [Nocardioides zeicaulis]